MPATRCRMDCGSQVIVGAGTYVQRAEQARLSRGFAEISLVRETVAIQSREA